jgi:hypothetical protein
VVSPARLPVEHDLVLVTAEGGDVRLEQKR